MKVYLSKKTTLYAVSTIYACLFGLEVFLLQSEKLFLIGLLFLPAFVMTIPLILVNTLSPRNIHVAKLIQVLNPAIACVLFFFILTIIRFYYSHAIGRFPYTELLLTVLSFVFYFTLDISIKLSFHILCKIYEKII